LINSERTSLAESDRMRTIRQRNTSAEMAIRHELHRRGLRFRLHRDMRPASRARPDIVFVRAHVAIFVDGCFWHCCPLHASYPKRNAKWWAAKLSANVARDRQHDLDLEQAGWTVIRIWEHESPRDAADKIARVLALASH
jgi:DNA mismatch endonuclease, patch repair protein